MPRGVDGDAIRRAFASDIRLCCLDDVKKLHYSILSRCPTAKDYEGEVAYNQFLRDMAPGVDSTACDVDDLARYMRELGQTMKDLREWRPVLP
jgi:endonuclease YncB( thermonuclease family)